MLREVGKFNSELFRELEDIENELFDNSFNATTLEREVRSGARLWVAGLICVEGYMLVRMQDGIADVLRLGVCPQYQGNGIGSALLKSAVETFPRLMLSVKKSNLGAIKLYKHHGFSITGDLGESWTMVTSVGSDTSSRTSRTG